MQIPPIWKQNIWNYKLFGCRPPKLHFCSWLWCSTHYRRLTNSPVSASTATHGSLPSGKLGTPHYQAAPPYRCSLSPLSSVAGFVCSGSYTAKSPGTTQNCLPVVTSVRNQLAAWQPALQSLCQDFIGTIILSVSAQGCCQDFHAPEQMWQQVGCVNSGRRSERGCLSKWGLWEDVTWRCW